MTPTDAPIVPQEYSAETADETRMEALLAAYGEVCLSYHAIDDFRTKLPGILPISSLAGIVLLGKDSFFMEGTLLLHRSSPGSAASSLPRLRSPFSCSRFEDSSAATI